MKKILFSSTLLLLGITVNAQDFFALTGQNTQNILFNDLRVLDLKRGVSGETIFSSTSQTPIFSQTLHANINESKASIHQSQSPTIASLAYDSSGNNLVYVPMFSSNIYIVNTKTKAITLVENKAITSVACEVGSHITRMTAGADGSIYAMSNSGSQFIKIINRNGKYEVIDLGAIKDISTDSKNALNVMQSGFGGDMVADRDNNLFVFSASGNIFKIHPKNVTSEFIGKIEGLPENYTLNGAAVNSIGNIVVASAKGQEMYEISMKDLKAKPVSGDFSIPVYDLASKYFLNESASNTSTYSGIEVYPTKVREAQFTVKISDEKLRGKYLVEVIDYMGNKVVKQNITVHSRTNEYPIHLSGLNQGIYIVNLTNEQGNPIFSTKIVVEK